MISVIAKVPVREEKLAEFLEALKPLMGKVAQEPGAVLYTVNRAKADPNTLVFMERYQDKAALAAHSSAPYLKEFFARMPEFVAGPPEITVMEELLST